MKLQTLINKIEPMTDEIKIRRPNRNQNKGDGREYIKALQSELAKVKQNYKISLQALTYMREQRDQALTEGLRLLERHDKFLSLIEKKIEEAQKEWNGDKEEVLTELKKELSK